MSDSPFRRFFAKAKGFVRPRGPVRKHKSKAGSTESLPSTNNKERASSPFKNTNDASSYESLPISPLRTQAYVAEPSEIESERRASSTIAPISSQFTHPTSSETLSNTFASPPWESWTLDQDFLSQVYTWNATHPENTLDRILKKTSTLIDRHDVLLELVPDGPIPFRGFVKALAHLIKLGTAVVEAKVVALQFAADILHWVENLADAFGGDEGGRFVSKAWANLAEIRKLIEEVCYWAHGMLEKGGIAERVSVNKKILEFRESFTQAIERFGVVSHIHITIGQERLNRHIHGLALGQDHMNQHLVTISQAVAQKRQSSMPDVTYEHQKKIPCAPGTRKQVLADIMAWIFDISEGSPCFFWLSGDPGVGKSAVTASIAEECRRRGTLWAQYFINRNDARTIDPQLFFPSIAKQMSDCGVTAVDDAVRTTLQGQPYLMTVDISLEQATKLFVDTIRVAAASTPTKPVAIVIDALDETDAKRLRDTVEIFSEVLIDLPSNAKVFISSRVENVIADHFAHHPRVRNIHLSAKGSIAEVTKFMEGKVRKIIKDHHLTWAQWGEQRMRRLCSQASGLFIWAVTAIEYIQTQIEESGTECLDGLLEELNAKGMDNINVLYLTILRRTYQRETSAWQTQRFQRIIGAILALQSPLSIDDLKGILMLRNPTNKALVDVEHFVRRLRTILVPGVDEITGRSVPRVHKSFSDFVTSSRAEEFCVDLVNSNGELALQCIDKLERLWNGEIPGQLPYAMSHWSSHLTRVVGAQTDLQEAEDDTESIIDGHGEVSDLEEKPIASVSEVVVGDASGSHHSISISSDGTRIVYAHGSSITVRDGETGALIGGPFKDYTNGIAPVVFSPDGKHIVSASMDKTVCIWDALTGELRKSLNGHPILVYTAFFSSDGKQVVSASSDGTIRLWDVETGQTLTILESHNQAVFSALFSPDGKYIVSYAGDATVRVWDWDTITGRSHTLEGHLVSREAYFSPDGKNVLSWEEDGQGFVIWDIDTKRRLSTKHAGSGLSFTTSEEAKYIEIPLKSNMPQEGTTPSYYFHVGENGVVGGVNNAWLYANEKARYTMGTYLGQLVMRQRM